MECGDYARLLADAAQVAADRPGRDGSVQAQRWISDLCEELGLKTWVCSTYEGAWRWNNVKRKTDKHDALKLARLAMLRQLKPIHIPKHEVREHRTLDQHRKTLD